ncbi:MAG: hypothetical protein ACI4KA_03880 [Oscillospiraceae bacterium]
MKIGKYPVKHTYSIARIIADVLSLGIAALIVSATVNFFMRYDTFLGSIMTITDEAKEAMLSNDPYYLTKQWLALIFPALMLGVFIAYTVLVLKSHKFSRYNVTKKTAQQCSDVYKFCASLCKIPALIIIADIMAITHDKLLPQYGFGWFSWTVLLYALIMAIFIRFTMHRLEKITSGGNADSRDLSAKQDTANIRIKAEGESVLAKENKEEI